MQWTDGYGLITEEDAPVIVDKLNELDWLVDIVEEAERIA